MSQQDIVKTLNTFLKGQYMGVHAYEHYIQKLDEPHIKKEFQRIQQEHKQHAQQVAERIQDLNGTPVDDEGLIGSVQGFIGKFMMPDETDKIIDSAARAESYYAVELSEEIVKGDVDPQTKQLIDQIIDEDRSHVESLHRLL
ncbi:MULTISPECIES: ferritin-like domain-containing protein [Pontibacillus]|uniref:Ferritin-like domain-containing protein n=1 Tax=Pontibacillus chungwhensis TaxID=265426 RepID=A0ABY8V230_9BACI|nr:MULTISPECIES: ferritin-like domain-containing protein [Pontibacillus]MCD5324645.1 ferritin-like domain-containing protein [Pontibacillus sp. HN14]WIF99061.1 ferritin-like domain-containing protein [Pontibacillus chungwhensis]